MKVLVANLGSTSFKYRLFDMNGEVVGVQVIPRPAEDIINVLPKRPVVAQ